MVFQQWETEQFGSMRMGSYLMKKMEKPIVGHPFTPLVCFFLCFELWYSKSIRISSAWPPCDGIKWPCNASEYKIVDDLSNNDIIIKIKLIKILFKICLNNNIQKQEVHKFYYLIVWPLWSYWCRYAIQYLYQTTNMNNISVRYMNIRLQMSASQLLVWL